MAADVPKGLIPISQRSPEEVREMGRKGGLASGAARRRRKTLREELLAILSDTDAQQKVSAALVQEAIGGNRAGSVARAFEILRDTIGEKPVERLRQAEPGEDAWPFAALSTQELRQMVAEAEAEQAEMSRGEAETDG